MVREAGRRLDKVPRVLRLNPYHERRPRGSERLPAGALCAERPARSSPPPIDTPLPSHSISSARARLLASMCTMSSGSPLGALGDHTRRTCLLSAPTVLFD